MVLDEEIAMSTSDGVLTINGLGLVTVAISVDEAISASVEGI